MARPPRGRRPAPALPELSEALAAAERVALVGVGSDLRGDDVAGVLVARRLASWAARAGVTRLLAVAGGAAPENFTGELVRFRPDLVVLVDAAHVEHAEPGALAPIPPGAVGGVSFSTHMLPVPIFLDYLHRMTGCRSLVLGIAIAQKEVMARPTPAVVRGVGRLVALVKRGMGSRRAAPARWERRAGAGRVTDPAESAPAGPAASPPPARPGPARSR